MDEQELNQLFPTISSREKFHIEMVDGAKVMVYKFLPNVEKKSEIRAPILFVPGFTSYFSQWSTIINYLVEKKHTMYVFESREKKTSTSKVSDPRFDTDGLIADLNDVVAHLKLSQPFFMIGNSLGSAMILKHVIDNEKNSSQLPDKIALLQAVYTSSPLQRFIDLAERKILFHIIMRFILTFSPIIFWKSRRKTPNSYRNSLNNLRNTELEKMRIGFICSVTLKILDDLPKVKIPTLAIGIGNDKTHPTEQAILISKQVKNGLYHEIPDKEYVDSETTAKIITDFLEK
ncbi:MAG: alpha/beta fold hydrolase [Candidatus Heimdallarchaeota archaeon]